MSEEEWFRYWTPGRLKGNPEPNPAPLPANIHPPHVPAAPVRAASPHRQAQPTAYGAALAQSLETAQQAIQDLAETHGMAHADILALVGEWLAESDWRQGRRVGVVTRGG